MNNYPSLDIDHQQAKADYDTWLTRAVAALMWFHNNAAQIRQRARSGEQVFVDLVDKHSKTWDMKEPSKKAFTVECEIVQAEYGDIVPWPEEVAIARKL